MDDIRWTQEGGTIPDQIRDVSEQMGDGGCLLIGGPDWVTTPQELGGVRMHIQKQGWVDMKCPVCGAPAPVYCLALEENLNVSCCQNCKQYGWFVTRKEKEDD